MVYVKRPKKFKDKNKTPAARALKPPPELPPLQAGPPLRLDLPDDPNDLMAPPRLLLDNDVAGARRYLRAQGFQVLTVSEAGLRKNASDEAIFRLAARQGLLLVTGDRRAYLNETRMPVRQSGGVVVLPSRAQPYHAFYEAALEHFARTCPQKPGALQQRIVAYEVDKRAVGRQLCRNEYAPAETGGRCLVSSEKMQPA